MTFYVTCPELVSVVEQLFYQCMADLMEDGETDFLFEVWKE